MSVRAANSWVSPAGVRLAGTGSALPSKRVTNADLERVMDTSDEWIVQRTGIRERRIADREAGETTASLATTALRNAMADARIEADEIDQIVCATMTPDMPTPSAACVVASEIGAGTIGAIDLNAACSGFVYALNHAYALIRTGIARTIAVIGVDCITRHMDFSTFGRGTSILFGDGAGAVLLRACDDASKGLIAQSMHSDGGGGKHLFIPTCRSDFFNQDDFDERKLDKVQMHGSAVFKFAVGTFPDLIQQTLDRAGIRADDVNHYVCHQSNMRILHAARDRFGLPEDKLCVNIDRVGNTVAASVPLVLDEQRRAGRIKEGDRVMFLAFGAGLTWASSLWQL